MEEIKRPAEKDPQVTGESPQNYNNPTLSSPHTEVLEEQEVLESVKLCGGWLSMQRLLRNLGGGL